MPTAQDDAGIAFDPDELAFEHCDQEPIHQPGAVQGFGYLVALDPESGHVRVYSENIGQLLSWEGELQNQDFFEWLCESETPSSFVRESYERASREGIRLPLRLAFRADAVRVGERREFDGVVYRSGDLMVLEVEPVAHVTARMGILQQRKVFTKNIAPMLAQLDDVDAVSNAIAETIRGLTEFERVLVLRFNQDDTGTVVGESVEGMDSLMGLTYPASDIPAQARALYLENWIRLNPDVQLPPVALVPSAEESGRTQVRSETARRAGRAGSRAAGGGGRLGRCGRHGRGGGHHRALTFFRRTIQMKTGAPTKAVTMPTSSSAGRAISRPSTSAMPTLKSILRARLQLTPKADFRSSTRSIFSHEKPPSASGFLPKCP